MEITNPETTEEDKLIKIRVLPETYEEFIGQERQKRLLIQLIEAARQRKEVADSVLIVGAPGLGKSSLAQLVKKDMRCLLMTKVDEDLLNHFLSWYAQEHYLFFDEFHKFNRGVSEALCYYLDTNSVVIGYQPVEVPSATIIAATTQVGKVPQALFSRFGLVLHLDPYSIEDLCTILVRGAIKLDVDASQGAQMEVANRARGNPRIALRYLKRLRDWSSSLDEAKAQRILSELGIDALGLDENDRRLLAAIRKFNGGPVGLSTLAAYMNEAPETIANLYEPYLIQNGFLIRTSKGRILTAKGIHYDAA